MRCPFCSNPSNRVLDKRTVSGTGEIRRRRVCLHCQGRFTTYERLSNLQFLVFKRSGHKEPYNRDKLKNGIVKALEKRPESQNLDELVSKLERKIWKKGISEVNSQYIGKVVLSELKKIDSVAYLRFASVYRHFENPKDFAKELESMN
ncbi:MAG: transcriptional regulator NrdR [Candidatus Daviesbacteria bacterium]|nr:transcriptional regulator NrdR [Candidatus Daviesbacteria bacterium]